MWKCAKRKALEATAGRPYIRNLLLLPALLLPAFGAQASVVFTSLHSFGVFPNGKNPDSGLVQGSDGNFYGTTAIGGTNGGHGTVFKISTNGVLTSLYSFLGGNDGANPKAGLVQGSDGSFYGTTYRGGANDLGTVFKTSTNGALTSLYSFTGGDDGRSPYAGLVHGNDGSFYGTTELGGTNGGYGTVFKISTNGALTTLFSFTGTNNGSIPNGLVQGSDGNFYGTTRGGRNVTFGSGASGWGTVFKITTNGVLTTLYSFTGGNDGAYPRAGLVQGSDGNLYGTTYGGGAYIDTYGERQGTVFKITTDGVFTSLHSFTSGDDGGNPWTTLVESGDGDLYGTTAGGGYIGQYGEGQGVVFKISTSGALTNLYSFTGGNDGANPYAGLVQGHDGNFYGTTYVGGAYRNQYSDGWGTVFKVSTNGTLTSLYSFVGSNDGAGGGLVQGSDGNFYGAGGDTVFKISTNGALTSLYFFTGTSDGREPNGGLVLGGDGNFYGTTQLGGAHNWGTVFNISTNGTLTRLYSFTGGNDGAYPHAGLVQGSNGSFYGTTFYGGTNNAGTVFKVSTNGALTSLYSFTGTNDGGTPSVGLVQGSDGSFYGTTPNGGTNGNGTVFKISAIGAFASLYSFAGTNDGGWPFARLVQGSDGNLYGTTYHGGANHAGTVFQIGANAAFTSLYSFTGENDGAYPRAGLVQGSDGSFYGTTQGGGTNSSGTVFQIRTNGALTTLYSFTGGNDGGTLFDGLVLGSDGSFYGTTFYGGVGGAGTVFRLTIMPEPPALTIIASGGNVILTWPTNYAGFDYTGFTLQSTTNLVSPAVWTTVSPGPVVVNGQNAVTNPISGTRQFYRLIK